MALERFVHLLPFVVAFMEKERIEIHLKRREDINKISSLFSDSNETFLDSECINHELLKSPCFLKRLNFIVDILKLMNQINLQLQGKHNYIGNMLETINKFDTSLELLNDDIMNSRIESQNFFFLHKYLSESESTLEENMKNEFSRFITDHFLHQLRERFQDIKHIEKVFDFLIDPLNFNVKNYSLIREICEKLDLNDPMRLRDEIVTLQSNSAVKTLLSDNQKNNLLNSKNIATVWKNIFEILECQLQGENETSQLVLLVAKVLSIFGSTWVCEASFSDLKRLKSKNRSNITQKNLVDQLRVALNSSFDVNFKSLVK